MRISVLIILAISVSLVFNSCKKDIEVPAYLHIAVPQFTTKSGQGTDMQNISYVGVYINDNLEGIYQTPITFPILIKGTVNIELRPYIKRVAREGYVNYTMASGYIATSVTLEEGKTDTVKPLFNYQSNVKFAWLDDFNNNTKTFEIDTTQSSVDTIFITKNNGPGIDSSFYAYINMGTAANPFFRIQTADQYVLPFDGRDVFMEFHYKTNVPFTVGITEVVSGSEIDLPTVTPFETGGEWRKAYVYLNDELVNAPTSAKYRVFVRAANGDNNITGEVFLDNFKLMYRE